MSAASDGARLEALYEGLARWHWLGRRLRFARAGEGLEFHKRLRAPAPGRDGPDAGTTGIARWLLAQCDGAPAGDALDVGCGFGATLFTVARTTERRGVGITASRVQVARAREQARRLGLGARCEFRCQDFEAPLEGRFAIVLALEALFHARSLESTLLGLARVCVPGTRLALCEDMLVTEGAREHADAVALARLWETPRLHTLAEYHAALVGAGFGIDAEITLDAQVEPAAPGVLARRERRLARLARFARWGPARAACFAYLGGIALERLQGEGLMTYRTIVATLRTPPSARGTS